MTPLFAQLAFLIPFTLIGGGLWIGLHHLEKTAQKRPTMVSGATIYTVGLIFYVVASIAHFQQSLNSVVVLMLIAGLSSLLGMLVFSAGFAIHCIRSGNLDERVKQLELMNLVQATELERLRNR